MAGEKIRLRFRKTGVLRLLSHLDMVRGTERMLRRADIPFRSTLGFHPTPRMVFALSLPLGADGLNEVLELELTRPLDAEDVRERLNRQSPVGLEFTSAVEIPLKSSAVPRSVVYTFDVPADRVADARRIADALMASEKVWVDRYKPRPRRLNIRPYLRGISIAEGGARSAECPDTDSSFRTPHFTLRADLWVTQTGTARADELLKLLGLFDLLDAGFLLARRELALRDETPSDPTEGPPDGPPETAPLDHAPVDTGDDAPAQPEWGLSPNGPAVE
jgi:radical SAM-linked protein